MGLETVATQVFIIFFLMFIGYVLFKRELFQEETARDMTVILVTLVGPCLILTAFIKPFEKAEASALFYSFLFNIGYFLIMILLSKLIFNRYWLKDKLLRAQSQFAFIYSNNGFMGVPLLMALFGERAIFFGAAQLAVSNAFIWSQGIGTYRKINGGHQSILQVVSNPNIIALFVALCFYFFSVTPPAPLMQVVEYIADLNTPISMMVVGASIAAVSIRRILNDPLVYFVTVLRLIVVPFGWLGVFMLWQPSILPNLAIVVIIIMIACPSPAMCIMFSKLFSLDETYSTKVVTVTTLVSVVTLPVLVLAVLSAFPI